MNPAQIADFCERYFLATDCHIFEKAPGLMKVKLSPEADRDLTGRPYYWNFVERTGAPAETMSFAFLFNPDSNEAGVMQRGSPREEKVTYGSRRLEQIFISVSDKGNCVQLFEEPPVLSRGTTMATLYTTWLCVNYRIEFVCDMKQEMMVSLGISMNSGEIVPDFHSFMTRLNLSPRIPARTSLRETITLERAALALESEIDRRLRMADYGWARAAQDRMNAELELIEQYYVGMIDAAGNQGEQAAEWRQQYERRKEEIQWQFRPRVEVCPINCGLFHLLSDTFRR